jgi:hypothetical protein
MTESEFTKLQSNWAAPRELSRSLPREVRLTGAGIALSAFAVLFVLGGIAAGTGLGLKAAQQKQRHEALQSAGRTTVGVITRLWRSGDKDQTRHVAYTFDWQGHAYRGQTNAPRKIWSGLKNGEPLAIQVVPANPEWNHPSEWPDRQLPVWLPAMVAVLLWLFAYLLSYNVRLQKWLLSEGRAAPAMVLARRKSHPAHGGHTHTTYTFRLPNGEVMKGNVGRAVAAGSAQPVLYLPDNPRRNRLYPLELVKLDQ